MAILTHIWLHGLATEASQLDLVCWSSSRSQAPHAVRWGRRWQWATPLPRWSPRIAIQQAQSCPPPSTRRSRGGGMSNFFNKERLKQLAEGAKAAGNRLQTSIQTGVQTAQQQVQQQVQQVQRRGGPGRRLGTAAILGGEQRQRHVTPVLDKATLPSCAGDGPGGPTLPAPPGAAPAAASAPPPARPSGSGLSSLSPEEAIHLLQSQVGMHIKGSDEQSSGHTAGNCCTGAIQFSVVSHVCLPVLIACMLACPGQASSRPAASFLASPCLAPPALL